MDNDFLAERIVEEAIALAEEQGWDGVRLRLVAARLDIPLTEVLARFRDLDAVADWWFRRAWRAMLSAPPEATADRDAAGRAEALLLRWFDALAPHRRVAAQMLRAKLYPSHPHQWVPMVFNLSRTVHWLRDAAGWDARGLRRQVEEVWLTAVFLALLAVWTGDDSPDGRRTREAARRLFALSPVRKVG